MQWRYIILIFVFLINQRALSADFQPSFSEQTNWTKQTNWKAELGVMSGTQTAHFNWSISGGGQGANSPSILSELTYRTLDIDQQRLIINLDRNKAWRAELELSSGQINSGLVQDSDYDGDNRTGEYSRSFSNPAGSTTTGIEATFQREILRNSFGFKWQTYFLAGFTWQAQHLEKTQGVQVLSSAGRTPELGEIHGLNSYYHANWYGPMIGLQPSFRLSQKQQLALTMKLYLTYYYAEADWNLRNDFAHPKSFEHEAAGFGQVYAVKYLWQPTSRLQLNLIYEQADWRTKNGRDRLFFADGTDSTTRLNETRWKNSGVHFGINWKLY